MNDIIFLNGMRFYGYHGVLPSENEIGQIFIVDVTLKVDLKDAGQSDDVADTGATLRFVYDFVQDYVADVRCAVVFEKPHSTVKCDYVWKRTDRWINFPWSTMPPVDFPEGV